MKTRIASLILLVALVGFIRPANTQAQFAPFPSLATPPPTLAPAVKPGPVAVGSVPRDGNIKPPAPLDIGTLDAGVDDGNTYNGYWWYGEGWVPGLPTFDAQFLRLPPVSIGSAVFYAPEVMDANVEYRGLSMDGYVGAVAVPFCSEIGHSVWLQRPGHDWEGPFLVADCSRRNDLYGHIEFRDQVVEVDFDTAVAWGLARYGGSQNGGRWSMLTGRLDCVLLSTVPPTQYDGNIVDLSVWFLQHVTYAERSENRRQIQNYLPPGTLSTELGVDNRGSSLPLWLINGRWVMFP
jgi:hypothetical protein